MTQTTLADLSGVDQYRISRLVNSQIQSNTEDLQGFLVAFPAAEHRYQIALAHIADQLPPDLFQQLQITLATGNLQETSTSYRTTNLTPRAARAIDFLLSQLPSNPAVTDVLIDLALALGWQPKRQPISSSPGKELAREIFYHTVDRVKTGDGAMHDAATAATPPPTRKARPPKGKSTSS